MNKYIATIFCIVAPRLVSTAVSPFAEIESAIILNNFELGAMATEDEAARLSDATENNLEDPQVEFEHLWGTGETRWNLGVSQSFSWPGLYGARSAANKARNYARASQLAARRDDIRFEARQLLIEAVSTRKQIQFADSMINNLENQYTKTAEALERGNATQLDLSKTSFALIELQEQREEIVSRLNSIHNRLVALNGGKSVDISSLDEYPAAALLDEQIYIDAFDTNSPQVSAMHAQTEAARAEARSARMTALPGFSAGYVHAYEDETHYNGFSLGMTLPVFSWRNRYKAAAASAAADELTANNYIIENHAEILAAVASARSMQKRLSRHEEVFNSCDYTGILQRLYDSGQINVIDYISDLNYFMEIRMHYLQLQCDYQLTLAALNRYLPIN